MTSCHVLVRFIEPSALRFAELVLHVLGHVRGTAQLPSSLYSRRYEAWAAELLGPAAARTLAEDARLLALEFPTHAALCRLQPLAQLFPSLRALELAGARTLAKLDGAAGCSPDALLGLRALGSGAELAWSARAWSARASSACQRPAPCQKH